MKIVLNDHQLNRRIQFLTEENDWSEMLSAWDTPDRLLTELQSTKFFKGRSCWSDLNVEHFHVILVHTVLLLAKMSDEECNDISNGTIHSFIMVVCAFVHSLQSKIDSSIESMQLDVVDEDVTYRYIASMQPQISIPQKLKIISG